MGLKADYYEALTWHALARIYGESNVRYEPDRGLFAKRLPEGRPIFTVPDFLVSGLAAPLFVHVCYWDSKETSHAKFWRTVSEIAELKCFVPGSQSLCIVFETSWMDGQYQGAGWYPEFLRALHVLADSAVFYPVPNLKKNLERLRQRLPHRAGTARIYREIAGQQRVIDRLASSIRNASHAASGLQHAVRQMWQRERAHCATCTDQAPREHQGERLRDAALQTVLLMLLFDWSAADVLSRLITLYRSPNGAFSERSRLVDWMSRLPVRYRGTTYTFLAGDVQKFGTLPIRCVLSDDLRWMVRALAGQRFPLSAAAFQACLEDIAADFRANPQVAETVRAIQSAFDAPPTSYAKRCPSEWVDAYESYPVDQKYNQPAELLIEAIGLGTYPLVRAYNEGHPTMSMTRDDLRALYSNRRTARLAARRRQLVRGLAAMIPEDVDWAALHLAYLHRKTARIVGPQSAINPMSCFVRSILRSCVLPAGFALVTDETLDTFASSVTEGTQLGTWRVAVALRSADEIIPLFTSAMRDPQDCAHKVSELAGHLRLARHTLARSRLSRTPVRRGIAVLEGGYGSADKTAFHFAGYEVCSLDNLADVVANLV